MKSAPVLLPNEDHVLYPMAMIPLNRASMAKKYKGKWVALKADRKTVVASGNSVQSVQKSALEKGCKEPIITRMPKSPKQFVGFHTPR
jgi:hypothetical protein